MNVLYSYDAAQRSVICFFFEHGNETSASIKGQQYVNILHACSCYIIRLG